ncbi:MAG: PAS domain-containing protein, partial [Pseudomonadota bacterium]
MRDHTEIEPSRHYADLISRFCADSIVITDGDGLTEWVNEAFTQMTGFTVDDMAGKKPGVVLQGPETDRNTVVAISKALQKRQP